MGDGFPMKFSWIIYLTLFFHVRWSIMCEMLCCYFAPETGWILGDVPPTLLGEFAGEEKIPNRHEELCTAHLFGPHLDTFSSWWFQPIGDFFAAGKLFSLENRLQIQTAATNVSRRNEQRAVQSTPQIWTYGSKAWRLQKYIHASG